MQTFNAQCALTAQIDFYNALLNRLLPFESVHYGTVTVVTGAFH
jgi:hypothetical protein